MQKVSLKPHQQKAMDQLANGKILWGGVGSGKSRTSLAYFFNRVTKEGTEPRDIYIITTAKKRDTYDWETEAIRFGISTHRSSSIGGIQLTVDSWNNLTKYKDVKNAFFIFDEQRLVGSGAWTKAFIHLAKHNQWILLSATPGDTWLDYIPVFIANGWYKNRTEFKQRHVVYNTYAKFPKVARYVEVGRLVRLRNQIRVHMPYERHTTRHIETVEVEYQKESFDKVFEKRWNIFTEQPIKNIGELFRVMRKLVNSDASRLAAVRRLSAKHPKLIVFYNFDYELELLRTLANDFVMVTNKVEVAEWNGHKHQLIPGTDRWIYLVQFTAGSEGWNCTDTDAMCFYSLTYSYKQWHQAFGRIDRLNTPFTNLWYYVLRSNSLIDKLIWNALKQKRSFNESEVTV